MTNLQAEALDDLRPLLPDWKLHLRAKARQPRTVDSYLEVASAFVGYLVEKGMPTSVSAIKREHIEHYLVAHGAHIHRVRDVMTHTDTQVP